MGAMQARSEQPKPFRASSAFAGRVAIWCCCAAVPAWVSASGCSTTGGDGSSDSSETGVDGDVSDGEAPDAPAEGADDAGSDARTERDADGSATDARAASSFCQPCNRADPVSVCDGEKRSLCQFDNLAHENCTADCTTQPCPSGLQCIDNPDKSFGQPAKICALGGCRCACSPSGSCGCL